MHRTLARLMTWLCVLGLSSRTPAHAASIRVCGAPGDQYSPSIVPDAEGGAIVVWVDGRDGGRDIYAHRIDVGGYLKWSTDGIVISGPGGTWGVPSISADGFRGVIVGWTDDQTGDSRVQRFSGSGVPMWPVLRVSDNFPGTEPPNINSNGSGGAFVVWASFEGDGGDIRSAVIDYAGHLPAGDGTLICNAPGDQFFAKATPDGAGGAFVSWVDVGWCQIDYFQHVDAQGFPTWGNAIPVSTSEFGDAGVGGTGAILWDGKDGVLCAWSTWPSQDIHIQHVSGDSALWGPNGIPVCTATGLQAAPEAVPDNAGGSIIAWIDHRTGGAQLYAQRVDAAGSAYWPPDGDSLCSRCVVQSKPSMISDGAGGAIITWADARAGGLDVYAQRITSVGTLPWGPDGIPISAHVGDQKEPRIASDGSGGAIIVWMDRRNGIDFDIYGTHVDSSGTVVPTLDVRPSTSQPVSLQISPNPFHGSGRVAVDIPSSGRAEILVSDVAGRVMGQIGGARDLPAGQSVVNWDGRGIDGKSLPAGVYFVQVRIPGASMTRRVVVIE